MTLVVKVPLKHGEEVKRFLISSELLDFERLADKDKKFLYFPIVKKEGIIERFSFAEFSEKKLKSKKKEIFTLTEALKGRLSEKELEHLTTSFDTVGSIAILEIDKEIEKKEKLIANTLLKIHKNIKTVVKKAGIHKGEFRTQKMKFLAGKKTLETVHKELNVQLKLNVEDVYFSPRLSNERKRIASLIRENEIVLVMFSGCAPYPCVLSKNSKAGYIYGIEINPEGHRYGIENLKLNKIHNVTLLNGDVHKIVPDFYKSIIGLKSSDNLEQLKKRLRMHPHIMELHLNECDLFDNLGVLEKTIESLKAKNIQVILHMPFCRGGERLSLDLEDSSDTLFVYDHLGKLCVKHNVKCVIHPIQKLLHHENLCNEEMLVNNLMRLRKYYDYFLFENVFGAECLFTTTENIMSVAKKAGLKNLCVDLCHLFLQYHDNEKIIQHIKALEKEFNLYFHIADTDGKSHGTELGTGKIDFERILPLVTWGIAEVTSKSEDNPVEQLRSYNKITNMQKTFDRILMPLPKSAENFLDSAFLASKKGTVIHFYDFLNEKDIPKGSVDKINKAAERNNKKIKILDCVRCGQHAPRTFRVCVDFEIL